MFLSFFFPRWNRNNNSSIEQIQPMVIILPEAVAEKPVEIRNSNQYKPVAA